MPDGPSSPAPSRQVIVDAHLHVWDPGRLDYPWLGDVPALNRRFGPADLDLAGLGPDVRFAGAVFVEAGRRDDLALAEVEWVEELAEQWPRLLGVVAHAPLERGADVDADLRALARQQRVRGVRRNFQDEPPGFGIGAGHIAGVRRLAEHDLPADLCVRHHQLPEVIELVRQVPEVTFVLDHLGKPDVRAGLLDPWREHIRRLAAYPNVYCKLSGLATEADHLTWRDEDVAPYLSHAIAEFGSDRCMFGGDWPVATLATGYARWVSVVRAALADRTEGERAAVLAGTAARVYRLPDPFGTGERPG
jgi:L-fuconolactonase